MTDATPITDISYFIEDSVLITTTIPPVVYGNSLSGTYPNLATDSRLTVVYEV